MIEQQPLPRRSDLAGLGSIDCPCTQQTTSPSEPLSERQHACGTVMTLTPAMLSSQEDAPHLRTSAGAAAQQQAHAQRSSYLRSEGRWSGSGYASWNCSSWKYRRVHRGCTYTHYVHSDTMSPTRTTVDNHATVQRPDRTRGFWLSGLKKIRSLRRRDSGMSSSKGVGIVVIVS